MGDIKTYLKISEEELKQLITEIQNKLKSVVESHMYKGNCTKKEAEFLLSKMYSYNIPHFFLCNLENPQKPDRRESGCSWI